MKEALELLRVVRNHCLISAITANASDLFMGVLWFNRKGRFGIISDIQERRRTIAQMYGHVSLNFNLSLSRKVIKHNHVVEGRFHKSLGFICIKKRFML